MLHAICDFCGTDCDRTSNLITIMPFQNFARYHEDSQPYGSYGPSKSFCMCGECLEKHGLPNPFHDYDQIVRQEASYRKCLDNYTENDISEDIRKKIIGKDKDQKAPEYSKEQDGGCDEAKSCIETIRNEAKKFLARNFQDGKASAAMDSDEERNRMDSVLKSWIGTFAQSSGPNSMDGPICSVTGILDRCVEKTGKLLGKTGIKAMEGYQELCWNIKDAMRSAVGKIRSASEKEPPAEDTVLLMPIPEAAAMLSSIGQKAIDDCLQGHAKIMAVTTDSQSIEDYDSTLHIWEPIFASEGYGKREKFLHALSNIVDRSVRRSTHNACHMDDESSIDAVEGRFDKALASILIGWKEN